MTSPANDSQQQFIAEIESAFEQSDRGLDRFYSNGFSVASGVSDVTILFKQNNKAVALGTMGYATAKDLVNQLSQQITQIEQMMGSKFLSGEELTKKLADASAKQ